MAAYRIYTTHHEVAPVLDFDRGCGCVKNVIADGNGHVALVSPSGKRLTDWVNEIVGKDGVTVRPGIRKSNGKVELEIKVPPKATMAHIDIPPQWHEHPEVVLQQRASCIAGVPRNGMTCYVLIDLRAFMPAATVDNTAVGAVWEDEDALLWTRMIPINAMKTRVMIHASHGYVRDGVYRLWLVASMDPKAKDMKPGEVVTIEASTARWIPIARAEVQANIVRNIELAPPNHGSSQ
jgi:hypothetical protein